MAEFDNTPSLIITIGMIALLLGVMAVVVSNFETGMVMPSDYVSVTDINVTFTDGYATLAYPECSSITAVEVP